MDTLSIGYAVNGKTNDNRPEIRCIIGSVLGAKTLIRFAHGAIV